MSILIKGMEMPDKCGHCRFATAFECEVTKNFITTFNVRQADCPLVPVPPHGRLIDASVAYDSIAELDHAGNYVDMDAVDRGLENTPTVLEASWGE